MCCHRYQSQKTIQKARDGFNTADFGMRPSGFEPLTYRLEGGCSIQLSYGRVENTNFFTETPCWIPKKASSNPGGMLRVYRLTVCWKTPPGIRGGSMSFLGQRCKPSRPYCRSQESPKNDANRQAATFQDFETTLVRNRGY